MGYGITQHARYPCARGGLPDSTRLRQHLAAPFAYFGQLRDRQSDAQGANGLRDPIAAPRADEWNDRGLAARLPLPGPMP
jgi:hypothetical protein